MVTLVISSIIGVYQFKKLDKAAKIFCGLVCLVCVCEFLALYYRWKHHNNMPVYSIYSLVEFFTISLYFNYSIDIFRKKNIGIYVGITGIILGILDIVFLQPLNTFNSYYLFFEGIGIITMALFSFFRLLINEDGLVLYTYPHFWFTAILSLFWSSVFINWGFGEYVYKHHKEMLHLLANSISIINIITYFAIGCVFLLFPKMLSKHV